ncbi:unnamed protein product [Amoebophrya sp. A120]|nr:unnamed protein product [Amoebophrya sp. A120]|eukprot:GSA120T00016628001.1
MITAVREWLLRSCCGQQRAGEDDRSSQGQEMRVRRRRERLSSAGGGFLNDTNNGCSGFTKQNSDADDDVVSVVDYYTGMPPAVDPVVVAPVPPYYQEKFQLQQQSRSVTPTTSTTGGPPNLSAPAHSGHGPQYTPVSTYGNVLWQPGMPTGLHSTGLSDSKFLAVNPSSPRPASSKQNADVAYGNNSPPSPSPHTTPNRLIYAPPGGAAAAATASAANSSYSNQLQQEQNLPPQPPVYNPTLNFGANSNLNFGSRGPVPLSELPLGGINSGSFPLGAPSSDILRQKNSLRSVESEKQFLAVNYAQDGPIPAVAELYRGSVTPRRADSKSPRTGGNSYSYNGVVNPSYQNPLANVEAMSPEPNPQLNDPINIVRDPKLLTPRQKQVLNSVTLPYATRDQPLPQLAQFAEDSGIGGATNEERLEQMFRGFVFDFYCGTYLTQLTSLQEKQLIHAQLIDDHRILALSQGSGRIVEFPIASLSKIYRISSAHSSQINQQYNLSSENRGANIIILEFQERKLAFLFHDAESSQRFLICFELLVRKKQQEKKAMR